MPRLLFPLLCLFLLASCDTTADNATEPPATDTPDEAAAPAANLREIDTDAALVATALLAAPEESRANAKVIGYNMAGEFVTLREGTNEFICLADDPKKDGFSAACYHKELDPFMARGRALRAEGEGSRYDPETAVVEGAKYRYVVYLPFATAASTGLPEAPVAPNHPWIMNPGTHRAHIMISPINGEE